MKKSEVKKEKNAVNGRRKLARRLVAGVIMSVALLLLTVFPAIGADSFYDSNLEKCEQKIKALGEEIQNYRISDPSPDQSLSQETGTEINFYRQKIISLQNSPEFSTDDLSETIELLYAKARGAGVLSWVYGSRRLEYSELGEAQGFSELFDTIKEEIENASVSYALTEEITRYPSRINREAFVQMIKFAGKSGDSLAVNAIAEGAIDSIETLEDNDLSGAAYKDIYIKAASDMELRRVKDKLTAELRNVYFSVYPQGDFESDRNVALFVYRIEDKLLVSDMNNVLNNTICDILSQFKTDTYTSQFITELIATVGERVKMASELESVPALGELFLDFSFQYGKANSKDALCTHIAASPYKDSGELLALKAEYTQQNGIFDLVSDEKETAFELKKALLRVDWYGDVMKARQETVVLLSPHDPAELLSLLDGEYKRKDAAIYAISVSDKNAELVLENEYSTGKEALEGLKIKAKGEKYLKDHATVLALPTEDADASFLSLLESALVDAVNLEAKVASNLETQVRSLYEKYKLAIIDDLRQKEVHVSAERLWENALNVMASEINSIPEALTPADFQSAVRRAEERAAAVAEVIDRFTQIISLEEYGNFSDTSKAALIGSAQNATAAVLSADFTPISWEQRLSEAKTAAMLIIEKAYSSAHLIAMAESAESPLALPIARTAAEGIERALTMAEVKALTEDADFRLSVILESERAEAKAESLKKEINSLSHLAPSQREDLCLETDEKMPSFIESILGAKNRDELSAVVQESEAALEEIRGKAIYEDLRNAKREANELLLADKELLKNEINTLVYISVSKKEELLSRLDREAGGFDARISAAENVKELDKILEDKDSAKKKLREDMRSAEVESCRENIKKNYDRILALRDRYSDENYNLLKGIIDASILFVESCEEVTALESEREAVVSETEKISTLLDDKKAEALSALDELFAAMSNKKSLYSAERFQILEKAYKNAAADISGESRHEYIDRIDSVLADAVAAMSAVPLDRLQTADGLILSESGAVSYPEGYSISSNGYPAYIWAEGKIPYGGTLKLISLPVTDIKGLPRSLVKDKRIYSKNGLSLSEDTLKLLKKSEFILGFKIDTSLEFDGSSYRLTFLLPDGTNPEDVVGIVGLSSSGSGVFYNYTIEGLLLSIDITSPGEFYLAMKKDSSPVLIVLIIGVILLAALCFALSRYLRYRGFIPFITPLSEDSSESTAVEEVKDKRQPVRKEAVSQKPVKFESAGKPVPHGKNKEKTNDGKNEADINADGKARKAREGAADEKNSAEQKANGVFGRDNKEKEETEKGNVGRGGRAEINLDLIAANFNAGDIVTLDALIEKGLLPQGTKWVKVLARGKINKPLTVIAQDFSSAAIRMILLAGGSATVAEEEPGD